ncbi:sensor histidine kinase [Povalibacter sp.]|uniref:sensor histidine kinase n=1 Tax=Povalibacter sp. TaxID=1962978 RepID=UPI002F41FF5E
MSTASIFKKNRDLAFWSLHAIGWSSYAISQYLGFVLYGKAAEYLSVIIVATISGFLLSAPLRYLCRYLWTKPPAIMISAALGTAYFTALVWRVIINVAYEKYVETDWPMVHWYEYLSGAMTATYLFACWMGLYFGFKYYESMQLQRERALRASALAQEAQLKMLRYQLNPHFLFNTLNAISTLIIDNRNSVANSAVSGLSEFLRYTLDQDPMKKVTVAQELEALDLYLNIEKMRFGTRLTIQYDIDDEATTILMPSLLLQPLIENAIKYAISPREEGGRIRIAAQVENGLLHLAVEDDGPGLVDPARLTNGRGVGIRNTRERLQVLYGSSGHVTVTGIHPGLRVALAFPAERTPVQSPFESRASA